MAMDAPEHPGLVRRAFPAVKRTVDADKGIYEGVITVETQDRTEDIIVATGGRLDNYLRNPVVPFCHSYYGLPVARALQLHVEAERITATWQFPPPDLLPNADLVRKAWHAGFLNALSIGIWPIRWQSLGDDDAWWAPRRYIEWEMLEFSIVVIPMHPDALRLSRTAKALPGLYPTRYHQEPAHEENQPSESGLIETELDELRTLLANLNHLISPNKEAK